MVADILIPPISIGKNCYIHSTMQLPQLYMIIIQTRKLLDNDHI